MSIKDGFYNMASKLSLTNLDFDGIKQSLIQFLSSQQEFSDYDFTGSGLNVLIDLLSYNTHYLGFYLNMVANEMFLDSADLRDSVVSLAKHLNYTPRSRNAATAVINFDITPPNLSNPPAVLTVEKNTKFTTTVDGTAYSFVTDAAHSVDLSNSDTKYHLTNITLREGTPFTFRYVVDTSIPNQRFVIPNSNVDISTISIRVQNSNTDTTITVFTKADDINEIDGTTPVFFVQEVEDQLYQVYFGDGIIGKSVVNGNVVIIEYLACNADIPNKASLFTAGQTIGGFGSIQVTTVNAAYGGAERETVESVKFAAPKNYEAQNRAVTVSDYKTLLNRDYPNADSLAVWGGEDNVPPVYGKVFISLKPKSGFVITQATKKAVIADVLKKRNVVTVIPEIIDPDYIFLSINSLVKYDPNQTTLSADAIKSLVFNVITNFSDTQISKFSRLFKFSKLVAVIDGTENSITNNATKINIQKRIVPRFGIPQAITVNFNLNNPIVPNSVSSTKFVSYPVGFSVLPGDIHGIDDDGAGTIRIFKQVGAIKQIVKANAGTVNYDLGLISLTDFTPKSIVDGVEYVKIFATPQSLDITPLRNNIITVDPFDVTVNLLINTLATV